MCNIIPNLRTAAIQMYLCLMVFGSGRIIASNVIYHEVFTAGTTTRNLPYGGWSSYEGPTGSVWNGPGFSSSGGAVLDVGSVNSNPILPDDPVDPYDNGFLYGYGHVNKASFMFTDEYSFSLDAWSCLHFSAYTNGASAEVVRAAVKVGNQWYVSDGAAIPAAAHWSVNNGRWNVDADSVSWYYLTFEPGTVLSVNESAASLPAGGTVTAFGLYVNALDIDRSIRLDNYKIEAVPRVATTPLMGFGIELLNVRKLWDSAPYNSFTDLIRFKDQWYCIFREGTTHTSPDGKFRVLRSDDAETWTSAALLTYTPPAGSSSADLRDAKLSITPSGQLMITCGVTLWNGTTNQGTQSTSYLSGDGVNWGTPYILGSPGGGWLWRTEWHNGTAYNFKYGKGLQLHTSLTGTSFAPLGPSYFYGTGRKASETAITFDGDICRVLARCDGTPITALLGQGSDPYDNFTWQDTGVRIGGPDMIQMPNGQFLAAVRLYDPHRTALCWVDPDTSSITEILTLPSGGDTSYAGMVLHDNLLWVSYYSSHETKTSIYLAKLRYISTLCASDLDVDGDVDLQDLGILVDGWMQLYNMTDFIDMASTWLVNKQ